MRDASSLPPQRRSLEFGKPRFETDTCFGATEVKLFSKGWKMRWDSNQEELLGLRIKRGGGQ